jgi:hypothetical protein
MSKDDQERIGAVFLHRKTIDSQVFQNAELFKVWAYCLMKANHKPAWVSVSTGRGVTEVFLRPGQFIFGRKKAAKELRMPMSSTWDRVRKLKNIGNLDIQTDTHFSIITIINWEYYQVGFLKSNRQPNTQPTTNRQPTDTNSNDSNEGNVKTSPADADILKKIDALSEQLYQSGQFPKVHAFKNKMLKQGVNKNALRHTLSQIKKQKIQGDSCWPYGIKIIRIEDGNFNYADFQKKIEDQKRELAEWEKRNEYN